MSVAAARDGLPGLDVVEIVDLRVPCVVGIHPGERREAQDLIVTVRLHLDVRAAAAAADLTATVDYARLAGELAFILQLGRFLLIESAATALALAVLHGQPAVAAVDVVLEKPAALGGQGRPRLHLSRRRDDLAAAPPSSLAGAGVDTVVLQVAAGADDRRIERLTVAPGATVVLPEGSRAFSVDEGRAGAAVADVGVLRGGAVARGYVVVSEQRRDVQDEQQHEQRDEPVP